MSLTVREIEIAEFDIVLDYFHDATPEFLETMGIDPTRIPDRNVWRERFRSDSALPASQRSSIVLLWLMDGRPVGFSSCDKIKFGERANMHLHILAADGRNKGIGTACARKSVAYYFDKLQLKTLFCEPYAFNIAPNRTLQKAGFKYLKTHMTVPGSFSFHQAVNRWAISR
jgi:RimJ/RimL family protein N-acetyltransferase